MTHPDLLPEELELLHAKLNLETAEITWTELQRFFAQGVLYAVDASVDGVYFKGVELVWDPVFDVLDATDSPATEWGKRCYFINTKFLTLRPIKNHWMVPRKPPRVYDRYTHYSAMTSRFGMGITKPNTMSVLSIA